MHNTSTPQVPTRNIPIYEIRIAVSAIETLTPHQRYTFYLLGHIFNELMCLQKLICFASPGHCDSRPIRKLPETAQAFFLIRVAACKVWEAKKALKHKKTRIVLEASVLPHMTEGQKRFEGLLSTIEDAGWIGKMRNQFGFHYPCFTQWERVTTPTKEWIDDSIFGSERSGNTFYASSEAVAREWFFRQSDMIKPHFTVESMIDMMVDVLKNMNRFLEDVIAVYIADVLHVDTYQDAGEISGFDFESITIPFWTHLSKETLIK
ncbi:hypothetical protein [Nitrosospira sp. Nsp1]|uniref:hypothetical protein n=1 Tax=Nitrosospira sp. Nsp1 TaxID=136547 RepID=UPI000891EED9|nr:hypothetical protein [Nitrosospira sp. Nsp1]SCX61764.1 hypothetical protein SAMN05720354_1291 [Nitrosospira sp. Nsp1]